MTDIRDFTPGTQEQRGAITVLRYPDPIATAEVPHDNDGNWRFGIQPAATPEADAPEEIWLRLTGAAVDIYAEDGKILDVVATELLQMAANSAPGAVLADGRRLAELKPEDLYRTTS